MTLYVDTETYLIAPGNVAPRHVVTGYARDEEAPQLTLDPAYVVDALKAGETVVAHNAPFDLAVLARATGDVQTVFDAVREGRVICTLLLAKFHDLSNSGNVPPFGYYGLARVLKRIGGPDRTASKTGPDIWRLRYAELDGVPVDRWPPAAVEYALNDVADVRTLYQHYAEPYTLQHTQTRMRAAWALQLASVWGLMVDARAVNAANDANNALKDATRGALIAAGILRTTGKIDTKALKAVVVSACHTAGIQVPTTPKGSIKTDKDTREALIPYSPTLKTYGDYKDAETQEKFYAALLVGGGLVPINPGYDALKETGRTSSFKPNVQNLPRLGGIRVCFRPRDGYVYCIVDYDSAELRSWAQICYTLLGHSVLQQRYVDDPHFDPHTYLAAQMLQTPYNKALQLKAAKDPKLLRARQAAKAGNFGYPGGMGAKTLQPYARGLGIELTVAECHTVRRAWFDTWTEARPYLDHIGRLTSGSGMTTITQQRSGRVRAACYFTRACNTLFQGLTADGALDAMWAVSEECYTVPTSPLFGSRPVAFIHDEILAEVPIDNAVPAAKRMATVMRERMQAWLPDVPVCCEPALSMTWTKDAEGLDYEHASN